MAGPSELTTYLDAARAAISSGNLVTARIQIALAETVLAEIPDSMADGVSVSYRNSLDAMKHALKTAESAILADSVDPGIEFS